MKTYIYRSRNALVLITTCLLFSRSTASHAMNSDAQSGRAALAHSSSVQPVNGEARLIIHRIPNLGNRVAVNLRIDGAPVASIIAYGHTYETLLPPGRHVLSVSATPNPRWKTPWQMTLDVQNGQTYNFTAMDDGSEHLILRGGLERPRAR
jgi:hypothetical protein